MIGSAFKTALFLILVGFFILLIFSIIGTIFNNFNGFIYILLAGLGFLILYGISAKLGEDLTEKYKKTSSDFKKKLDIISIIGMLIFLIFFNYISLILKWVSINPSYVFFIDGLYALIYIGIFLGIIK